MPPQFCRKNLVDRQKISKTFHRANKLASDAHGVDVLQLLDPVLVDNLNLEVWQVDDQTLLDLPDAILRQIVSFVTAHVGVVLVIHEGSGEEPSVPVSRELGGRHRRQVVEDVELALGLLVVVPGNQQVNIEGGLKGGTKL